MWARDQANTARVFSIIPAVRRHWSPASGGSPMRLLTVFCKPGPLSCVLPPPRCGLSLESNRAFQLAGRRVGFRWDGEAVGCAAWQRACLCAVGAFLYGGLPGGKGRAAPWGERELERAGGGEVPERLWFLFARNVHSGKVFFFFSRISRNFNFRGLFFIDDQWVGEARPLENGRLGPRKWAGGSLANGRLSPRKRAVIFHR